jgi:mRNA interferase MazF
MIPKVGEVYMLDLGFGGKVRPIVIMSREEPEPPGALSLFVPLTKESRPGRYEITMPRVPWLKLQSYANVQGLGSVGHHELVDRRGRFEAPVVRQIKAAIRWAFDL